MKQYINVLKKRRNNKKKVKKVVIMLYLILIVIDIIIACITVKSIVISSMIIIESMNEVNEREVIKDYYDYVKSIKWYVRTINVNSSIKCYCSINNVSVYINKRKRRRK